MPRRVQDIIPASRRTIRDISKSSQDEAVSIAHKKDTSTHAGEKVHIKESVIKIHREHTEILDEISPEVISPTSVEHKKRRNRSKSPLIIGILGVIVVLAGVAFTVSSHFASATFTLVPKVSSVNVNGTYIILSSTQSVFGYEVITLTDTASTTIPATQGTYTETKAQGPVTVYNSYSSQSQRIVAGSRMVGASGLVYRLTSTIVVPGFITTGSSTVPGSIITTMVADKAGDQYNVSGSDSISDFKFMAYEGTPKGKGFYVRLMSNISGGFSGTRIIVSPTLLASTTLTIQKNMSTVLRAKLASNIPNGYVMYSGVYGSTFGSSVVAPLNSQLASISAPVTVYGIIFKKIDLARLLSGASSTNLFGSFGYDVPNIDSLSVSLANPKDFSPVKKTNLALRITGSFNMIGTIPVDTLKKSFAGVSLTKTADILKKYSGVIDISHSSAEITPPWVGTVPNDINRISIIIK